MRYNHNCDCSADLASFMRVKSTVETHEKITNSAFRAEFEQCAIYQAWGHTMTKEDKQHFLLNNHSPFCMVNEGEIVWEK